MVSFSDYSFALSTYFRNIIGWEARPYETQRDPGLKTKRRRLSTAARPSLTVRIVLAFFRAKIY